MARYYTTPPAIVRRNAILLAASIVTTFVVLRLALLTSPDSDFNVGSYNIHHLFTGLLLITLGGIPLAVFRGFTRRLDLALVVFGVGLGMALDERVYLIATEGSNAAYLLPISWWGGITLIALACAYTVALVLYRTWLRPHDEHRNTAPSDGAHP